MLYNREYNLEGLLATCWYLDLSGAKFSCFLEVPLSLNNYKVKDLEPDLCYLDLAIEYSRV